MTEKSRRGFAELTDGDLDPDPIVQFGKWFQDVLDANVALPHAMTLATSGADDIPSARTVLLKGVDEDGFLFFTNHGSRKAREIDENPHAALVLYWQPLDRQVCVRGPVVRLSRESSERYWRTRPRDSQIGAWASKQSQVLDSRAVLDERVRRLDEEFGDVVPLPEFWGGYKVTPVTIEFWQGRTDRLHDRFRYTRVSAGAWQLDRLYP